MADNQDALDRKGAWIERMFDKIYAGIKENPLATLLVLSIGLNLLQYNEGQDKDKAWRKDITALNEKINAAIEKSVERGLEEKLAPIRANNDRLDTSLTTFEKTVKKFKEKYNK